MFEMKEYDFAGGLHTAHTNSCFIPISGIKVKKENAEFSYF